MKKLILLIALVAPILSFAQIEKGMFLLSGNLSFQKNNSSGSLIAVTSTEVNQIEFTPYLGYMVSPRVAIGLVGGFAKSEQKLNSFSAFSAINFSQQTTSAGPFVRYYQPISEKFFFFAQGDVTFARAESTQTAADPSIAPVKAQITSTAIALRPGVSYFISKRWAVEVVLGSVSYVSREFKSGGTSKDVSGYTFNFITRGVSPGILFTF